MFFFRFELALHTKLSNHCLFLNHSDPFSYPFSSLELEDGKLAVYLQTVDRGPDFLWDEDRFIPSDAVVEMIRLLLKS